MRERDLPMERHMDKVVPRTSEGGFGGPLEAERREGLPTAPCSGEALGEGEGAGERPVGGGELDAVEEEAGGGDRAPLAAFSAAAAAAAT